MMLKSMFLTGVSGLLGLIASAQASGNYGPDTCLEGWVWREAYPGDVVCVTPDIRTQTANDNAAASSRVNPKGPYGPDTCVNGYVWREADASDHVCVTPETRAQAAADNAQAANRRASLNIWISHWYPPEQCNGDTCSITSDSDIPHIQINGDHFNFASIIVGIYKLDSGMAVWTSNLTPSLHAGFVAGSFGIQAPEVDCSGGPDAKVNSYAAAYDSNSDRWSTPVYISIGCATL